jgi:hypothetical protein
MQKLVNITGGKYGITEFKLAMKHLSLKTHPECLLSSKKGEV